MADKRKGECGRNVMLTNAETYPPAIEAVALTKRFGNVVAVDGVSFQVRAGEMFGFLGPNGAGKTTTINLLIGLARPTAGSIRFLGEEYTENLKAAQYLLGVVPDESNLYPELNGFENLCFCAALYGMPRREREARARQLLDLFGLTEAAERTFAAYSRGMKRKLTLAAGIIHRPRILFLDEPTTGLDVASARQIRHLLRYLQQAGATIFLTTHYIEEAERLCDRVAFIVKGRIVRLDSVQHLLEDVHGRHIVQFTLNRDPSALVSALQRSFPDVRCEAAVGNALRVQADQPLTLAPFIHFFEDQHIEVTEARKVQWSLEEVFVRETGIEAATMESAAGEPRR